MQNTYCEYCKKPLSQHEFERHFCREIPQPSRGSEKLSVAGKGTSVIKHTSDARNTSKERTEISNYLRESCKKAVERIYSRIQIEFEASSTSNASGGSTETRNGERPHVNTQPNDYSMYRPSLTEAPNKQSSLRDRDGAFSRRSQISNVPQANSEAGTFATNLKTGKYTVVSKSAVKNLKESSATAMERMMFQMREQTANSNRLDNASPQETRTSVKRITTHFIYRPKPIKPMLIRPPLDQSGPSTWNRSSYATQENSKQAATSAGKPAGNPERKETSFLRNLLSKKKPQQAATSTREPTGNPERKDSLFLRNLLSKKKPQQATTSGSRPETATFSGGPSGSSQGACSSTLLQDLRTKKKPQQATTSGLEPETATFAGGPSGSSQGACSSTFLQDLRTEVKPHNFFCKLCKINYGSWDNLDRHIDRLVNEGVVNAMAHKHSPHYRRTGFFVCMNCRNRFDTKSDLDSHWENNHSVETPYKCIFCKCEYQLELYLTKHENTVHAGRTIFKCPECYKRFISASGLVNHHCVPLY